MSGFAEYNYQPVYRRFTIGNSGADPKDDPELIASLHGVSGLTQTQIEVGYFSKQPQLSGGKLPGGYTKFTSAKLLQYDFELVSTPVLRSYRVPFTLGKPETEISYQITRFDDDKLLADSVKLQVIDVRPDGTEVRSEGFTVKSYGLYGYLDERGLASSKEDDRVKYATTTYRNLINTNLPGSRGFDFRYFITEPARKNLGKDGFGDDIAKQLSDPSFNGTLGNFPKVNSRIPNKYSMIADGVPGDELESDFIPFSIYSISRGKVTQFTVFLTSFNDSFNANWQDLKYVGRQDTLKYFTGVTRAASVGFKIAAFKPADMKIIYKKLDDLVSGTVVGGIADGAKTITAPYCQLTLGRWFINTFCVVNSIKFDIQTADYAWDIRDGYYMPQLIDVSMDFTILGDRAGAPLEANSNFYFDEAIR